MSRFLKWLVSLSLPSWVSGSNKWKHSKKKALEQERIREAVREAFRDAPRER